MATKIKALQQWCKKMTEGYRDVEILNFTTSWRNGLAFCAIIHRFRPDLIDYDSLSKENVFDNNHLAFTVAEQELDITAYLEAADMVALKVPDKLSIITYVSQYYNKLHALPQLGGPGVKGKTALATQAGTKRHQTAEPLSEPETKKQPPVRQPVVSNETKAKGKSLGDKCAICRNKVYLLERHVEAGQLYHRSCFRHSDLSPSNEIYTRSPFLSPSLRGKDSGKTPSSKSSASVPSLDKVTDVSKTYVVEGRDKRGVKRPSDDVKNDEKAKSKTSDVQRFLFSDRNKPSDKPADQKKSETKFPGVSKGETPKEKQLSTGTKAAAAKLETQDASLTDRKSSPTPISKFGAHGFERRNREILSAEKEPNPAAPHTRPLPLVFQASDSAADMPAGKSKPESEEKSSLFSLKKVFGSKTDNNAKSGSKTKVAEQHKEPVSRPGLTGRKNFEEKMDTSEEGQKRSKSPNFPRAALGSNLDKSGSDQKAVTGQYKTSLTFGNVLSRSKSPEPSCPPPLPSSPPPLKPVSISPRLSPRHVSSSEPQRDTAMSKTPKYGEQPRAVTPGKEQEKGTLTGLLKSLAHVRQPEPATNTSTSVTVASSRSATPGSKDVSSEKGGSKSVSSGGFVSGKISQWQNKDADHKAPSVPASNIRTKSGIVSPRDIQIKEVSTKGATNMEMNNNTKTKVSPRHHDPKTATKVSDLKLGETVTLTINTDGQSAVLSDRHKISAQSKFETKQTGTSGDDVPKWKQNLASRSKGNTRDATDNDSKSLATGFTGDRDRSNSASDAPSVKPSKQKGSDSLQPPPFTQVKLRETGNKTPERNNRSKSEASVLESDSVSKPDWQVEAERRMAALREIGFVDPETKQVTSSSKSGDLVSNYQKEDATKSTGLHSRSADLSPREGSPQAKSDSKTEIVILPSKKSTEQEKEKSGKSPFKLNLKGILQSEEKKRTSPSGAERFSLFKSKPKDRDKPAVKSVEATKEKVGQDLQKDAKPEGTKMSTAKATVDDSGIASPPPRPTAPPRSNRKTVPVEVTFDFNSSNSAAFTPKAAGPTSTPKLTPPARPPAHKRTSMSPGQLSAIELQKQLLDIDNKLSELELRGRHLEESIRSVDTEEEDDDDVMMEWFQLVTQKNELVRQETDLVYMSREQDLLDEQSQIESQLHYLVNKDESEKSFEEQQEEEYLIQRKVDIVNQRNSIVDSMDEDRLRYEEEDRDIAQRMQEKVFRRESLSADTKEKLKSPKEKGKSPKEKGKTPKNKRKTSRDETHMGSSTFYA